MQDETRFMVRMASGAEFGPADITMVQQWAREGRVPSDAALVPTGGGEPISVLSLPELALILQAPPVVRSHVVESPSDEGLATLIPYRNAPALTGYYVSIASLFPVVGAVAGPIAIRLGVVGLRKRREDPRVHGTVHAWIAIILGAIGALVSVTCISAIVIALVVG